MKRGGRLAATHTPHVRLLFYDAYISLETDGGRDAAFGHPCAPARSPPFRAVICRGMSLLPCLWSAYGGTAFGLCAGLGACVAGSDFFSFETGARGAPGVVSLSWPTGVLCHWPFLVA